MEGGNARVKESGAIAGEKTCCSAWEERWRGLLRMAAKGAKRDAGTNNAIIVKTAGKPGFMEFSVSVIA